MSKLSSLLLIFIAVGLLLAGNSRGYAGESNAAGGPPQEGKALPEFRLSVPQDAGEVRYLGIKGESPFKLSDVQADIVILEIFSMYCPYCQREAPNVNELYKMTESGAASKVRIKLIGIGVGNSPYEVSFFKTQYGVQFPLFADPDFSFHKALGRTRTPCFIAVDVRGKGSPNVLYSKEGSFGTPREFLNLLQEKLRNNKKGK